VALRRYSNLYYEYGCEEPRPFGAKMVIFALKREPHSSDIKPGCPMRIVLKSLSYPLQSVRRRASSRRFHRRAPMGRDRRWNEIHGGQRPKTRGCPKRLQAQTIT